MPPVSVSQYGFSPSGAAMSGMLCVWLGSTSCNDGDDENLKIASAPVRRHSFKWSPDQCRQEHNTLLFALGRLYDARDSHGKTMYGGVEGGVAFTTSP